MGPASLSGNHSGSDPSDILDPIAFQARTAGIEETELQAMLAFPRFRAAVVAFRLGLIPLGYAVYFVWPEIEGRGQVSSPSHVADLICYAMRRSALDSTDPRHISPDEAAARSVHPGLFEAGVPGKWQSARDRFEREMEHFAEGEPWRDKKSVFVDGDIQEAYASYWLSHSKRQIEALFSDRRFLAAFDAYRQDFLSYFGLVEKVYGTKSAQAIFAGLGLEFQGVALRQLADAANRGDIPIPQDLQNEYPEMYVFYQPEIYGSSG